MGMENLLSLVILLHVGFAGAFPCRSSCTSCMSSLWVFQLPPTTKQTLLSKARSSQHSACRCRDPDWLLCIRHHLQVRSRASDLPNHVCKVLQGMPVAMRRP